MDIEMDENNLQKQYDILTNSKLVYDLVPYEIIILGKKKKKFRLTLRNKHKNSKNKNLLIASKTEQSINELFDILKRTIQQNSVNNMDIDLQIKGSWQNLEMMQGGSSEQISFIYDEGSVNFPYISYLKEIQICNDDDNNDKKIDSKQINIPSKFKANIDKHANISADKYHFIYETMTISNKNYNKLFHYVDISMDFEIFKHQNKNKLKILLKSNICANKLYELIKNENNRKKWDLNYKSSEQIPIIQFDNTSFINEVLESDGNQFQLRYTQTCCLINEIQFIFGETIKDEIFYQYFSDLEQGMVNVDVKKNNLLIVGLDDMEY